MNLKKEKREFLRGMQGWNSAQKFDRDARMQWALDNTVHAAENTRVGTPVYAAGIDKYDKHEVQDDWKLTLWSAGLQYDRKISGKLHLRRIAAIADFISGSQRKLLHGKRMRFGVSQKALNLYLKYLWCLDIIPEPPHCPLDGIMLNKIAKIGATWTKSDCPEEYEYWIKECRKKAEAAGFDKNALPAWELKSFNDYNRQLREKQRR